MKAMPAVVLLLGLVLGCGAQTETTTETVPPPSTSSDFTGEPSPPTPEPSKEATYWVTFNTNVRPGQMMSFHVLILKGTSPVYVTASLLNAKGDKVILQSEETICIPGSMQTISIELPLDIEKPSSYRWDDYRVLVVGEGEEVKFNKTGYANLQHKALSTLIQTDKAMYKPGQEVRFRVVSMGPQLRVMQNASYDIIVKDPKGNRIVDLRDVTASEHLGVVQSSFQLADMVPTGDWEIEVTVMGFEETKSFTVSDYVLPKFEVEIEAPAFGIINDTHLMINVTAKYTFGKPVTDSRVVVTVKGMDYEWYYNRPQYGKPRPSVNIEGMLSKDGKYEGQVLTADLLRLVNHYNPGMNNLERQRFHINATVTEARTYKIRHAEHQIQYFATPLEMKFLDITPESFKSGLNFTSYLEVRKRDGTLFTPEEAKNIKIKFNVTYNVKSEQSTKSPPPPPSGSSTGTDSNALEESETAERSMAIMPFPGYVPQITKILDLPSDVRVQTLTDNGWLVVRFGIPSSALSFRIQAESETPYIKPDYATFYGNPANSPSETFLQLNVTNHKPKVNDKVHVKAKATKPMKALFYQITAKGILLRSQNVTPPSPSKEIEFEFLVEYTMTPNLNLLAFFVTEAGEFVVDALSLSVEGLFENSVEVRFSKDEITPGEDVDVVVKGRENSMVFLLAVDKSVKLLKSGNDITQELVRQELLKYEFGENSYGSWRYMFICGWPSYYSGTDAASVFSSAGVQVLTDGLVYREPHFAFENDEIMAGVPESSDSRGPGDSDSQQEKATGSDSSEKKEPRSNFAEIMLWDVVTIDEQSESNGEASKTISAPDTITSWVMSAFSSHPTHGLSVAAEPAEVITFKDLFVSLDLPSFIVRHEMSCFTASVFYYFEKADFVWVTVEKSTNFSGILTTMETKTKLVTEKKRGNYNAILGKMKNGDIKSARFCITPEVLGIITVTVTAHTNKTDLHDSVKHQLRVKPEGVPRSINKPYLVSLQNGQWQENVPVVFPPNTVEGSGRISVNVAGNLLASVFENIDGLVRQPYGCGEQNMINLAPLSSLLKFFIVADKLTPEIEKKLHTYMLQGYQREITYEHTGGGYSAFGEGQHNNKASTWLTAFVVRCFAQAHQIDLSFIDINTIIRSALWLGKMNVRGAYVEYGKVFNKKMQGGSGAGQALTAYTVIALHEAALAVGGQNSTAHNAIISARDKGIKFLEVFLSQATGPFDPYDIIITTYALHLVDSKQRDTGFDIVEDLAITSSSGMKYWKREGMKPTHRYPWSSDTDAQSIEMTSYALLIYLKRGIATSEGLGIINWLTQHKNPNGGFISTQDTVVGIEALSKFLSEAQVIPMDITVTTGSHTKTFVMTKENDMLLQKFEVPEGPISYNVSLHAVAQDSSGNSASSVLVEVAQYFNVQEESESDQYKMELSLVNNTLFVKIQTINGELSGMALLDVELPSGYGVEVNDVRELNPASSKVEWKHDDLLSLYFQTDVIGPRAIKVEIPLVQTDGLTPVVSPKNIKLTDYYEPGYDLTMSYRLTEKPFCEIAYDFGLCPFRKPKNTVP